MLCRSQNLAIREHPQRGIYVENMAEEYVTSPEEMFDWMRMGSNNRAQACPICA